VLAAWSTIINRQPNHVDAPNLIAAVLLSAMAGGLGWGIRGQFGHETGAMIAGVLVGFTLVLLFFRHLSSLQTARAVALFVLGISCGGAMTYGQTLGLTQNPGLVGNWHALSWGLLGVFIKGGIWIGLAGAFLGMGVGGERYRAWEGVLLLLAMLGLIVLGVWLFNRPFDPAHRVLPRIYFSADWVWEPTAQLKPRPECWGGLLCALLGLIVYLGGIRRDRFAAGLAFAGFLAGGIGFALGQTVQAAHAWNRHWFEAGSLAQLEPYINWWNMMEITFGATFAGLLAVALWLRARFSRELATDRPAMANEVSLSPAWEAALIALYVSLLVAAEFSNHRLIELFLESGIVMGLIPMIFILGGRYGPYFYALPIVALPIAGKTLHELAYANLECPVSLAWPLMFVVPLVVTIAAAWWFAYRGRLGQRGMAYARGGLIVSTALYWSLNVAFFRFPWPWQPWTARTPSALIFTVCAVSLIGIAIWSKNHTTNAVSTTSPQP
jgi:hypothetical protein